MECLYTGFRRTNLLKRVVLIADLQIQTMQLYFMDLLILQLTTKGQVCTYANNKDCIHCNNQSK